MKFLSKKEDKSVKRTSFSVSLQIEKMVYIVNTLDICRTQYLQHEYLQINKGLTEQEILNRKT